MPFRVCLPRVPQPTVLATSTSIFHYFPMVGQVATMLVDPLDAIVDWLDGSNALVKQKPWHVFFLP